MQDNKCKTNVKSLLCNEIYPFTYDVNSNQPGEFPDLEVFHIDNF